MNDPYKPTTNADDTPVPVSERRARSFQRGDPAAVREVRRRVSRILRYGGLAIPVEEREDLEQEVMTEIWAAVNRSGFDASAGFWSFVEVVASRRSIDWLRARRNEHSLPDVLPSPAEGPLQETLARERGELVQEVLSSIGARCRELITLRLRDGLSYREIGKTTGKSEGALRVQLYRCVRRARRLVRGIAKRDGRKSTSGGQR